MISVHFDDVLPRFAAILRDELGAPALEAGLFLRGADGRVTFVLDRQPDQAKAMAIQKAAVAVLNGFVEQHENVLATPEELFDRSLADPAAGLRHVVRVGNDEVRIRVVDRLFVGADWLSGPAPSAPLPRRFVFASLKGGVGRSTALCVLAAEIAARGGRVLAIDLDLEAPGIGSMLLEDKNLPPFGMLDYVAEFGLGTCDDDFIADLKGSSWLGQARGRVDVIPVFGRRSLDNPAEVLPKIGRAYLEKNGPDGARLSFLGQVRTLVNRLSKPEDYDAVLVDARAGLHESTAAAVLGLGAEVFLFGLDQPQTFPAYGSLFAHLARFPIDGEDDWRDRLILVQAKAAADRETRSLFALRCRDLLATHKVIAVGAAQPPAPLDWAAIGDVDWPAEENVDEALPDEVPGRTEVEVVPILEDARYRNFDPLAERDLLGQELYRATFGPFLDRAMLSLALPS